jgi:hypothetical protein
VLNRKIIYIYTHKHTHTHSNRVDPAYNDFGLYDTPPITSVILWYQLIPHC